MQWWLHINSKRLNMFHELTGYYCGHSDHFQKIFQMPKQLLYSGLHWRPNTPLDENICSNVSVQHNLEEKISHPQLEITS
jgi:hypothetical protein